MSKENQKGVREETPLYPCLLKSFHLFLIIMMIQKGKRIRTSLSIRKFSISFFLALHSVVHKPMSRNVFGCDYFQYESEKDKE